MSVLEFFTVNAHLSAVVVDYVDADLHPDVQNVSATVDFIPRLLPGELVWANGLIPPSCVALPTIRARFDTDGYLRTVQSAPVNEQQTITLTGAPTSYKVAFNGSPASATISGSATNVQVQAAISALTTVGVGNIGVSGPNGGPYVVTFGAALGFQDVPQLVISNVVGGTSVVVTTTRPGALNTGIELLANTAALNLDTLIYDVAFSNVVYAKNDQVISPFGFISPTVGGVVVDLASVPKLPPKPGIL